MKQILRSYHKKSALLLMLFIMAIAVTTTAQSLKFNGTSQYGRVPNNAALQLKSFTIEMWVRPETGGTVSANGSGTSGVLSAYPLLSKGRGESETPAVDVNYYAGINSTTNKVGFDFEDDNGSVNHPVFSATPLVSCVWQHVAASYNDTTGVWKVYINGILDSTKTLSTNFHPQSLSTVNLSFGTAVNSTNVAEGFFSGSMDEIRIWKKVRTDAEISANKNLEITSHTDLAARYGLNDGTGTSAVNSSSVGAAINASLFGTPVWNGSGFDATPSIVVGAIDFDGTNDHIVLGSAASLRATTFTLEGWIKMEGPGVTASSGTGGIVAVPIITKGRGESETAGINMNYFLGVDANNVLVADFEEATGPNHKVIGNTQLKQNIWYHVAASYGSDGVGGKEWKLYINGELDKQQTEAGAPTPEPNSAQHSAIGTAMNSTGVTEGFFNGKIDEVRIWNVVRTGTDIANNYLNEISSGAGLIGRWSFNECSGTTAINTGTSAVNGTLTGGPVRTVSNYNPAPSEPTNRIPVNGAIGYEDGKVSGTVSDRNNQPLTVKLFGRKKTGTGSNFTIIGLPDTQFYTEELPGTNSGGGGNNAIFKAQTQWIADHRVDSNIAFVVELGDCVQNGNMNEIEWKRADTSMKNIENPNVPIPHGIPYTVCVGNHDQGATGTGDPLAATTFYNQYFGEARFLGRPYYGGHYGSNNDNNYQLFSAGGINFIHISLEYNNNSGATNQAALQGVLDWADALLKAYPNHKGILSTHWLTGTGNPASFQGPGQKIYDDLKDNPNLILMLAGHVAGQGRRTDVFNGNTVHTLMSDYQSGYTNGGNGYLRIMQFRPASNTLSVKTFSPTSGALPNATEIANGNFDLSVSLTNQFALITTVNNVTSSSNVDLSWPNLEPFTEYEWYVTVSDGENELTSQVFSFTMAGVVPVNLLDFTGKAENKQVKLNWKTATEGNSNRFDVERSTDGRSFTKIAEVAAKGNSNSIQQYNSYDANPANGINHYRLKMVNNDGSFTYSRVIHVSMNDKAKGFDIYPNPVSGNEINIVFTNDVKGKATIRVHDINGRLRVNTTQMANNNNLQLKHNLPPGMYIISIMVNNKEESRKIIIE